MYHLHVGIDFSRDVSENAKETCFDGLAYLLSIGLILLISTKVRRAYTNWIQLLFAKEVLTPNQSSSGRSSGRGGGSTPLLS